MHVGLLHIPDDAVVFVLEDDDVYLPDYMTAMLKAVEKADLIGERDASYYNVSSRYWRILPGKVHSSMASTVCRGEALALLKKTCDNGVRRMLDYTLWRSFAGSKELLDNHNVIGIKGLPGRPGIGVGHRKHFGAPDTHDVLRAWIGEYANNYDIFREAA